MARVTKHEKERLANVSAQLTEVLRRQALDPEVCHVCKRRTTYLQGGEDNICDTCWDKRYLAQQAAKP